MFVAGVDIEYISLLTYHHLDTDKKFRRNIGGSITQISVLTNGVTLGEQLGQL